MPTQAIIGLPCGKVKADVTCKRCNHDACKRFGYFGKRRVQRWRCTSCKATFCEPHEKLTRDTMTREPGRGSACDSVPYRRLLDPQHGTAHGPEPQHDHAAAHRGRRSGRVCGWTRSCAVCAPGTWNAMRFGRFAGRKQRQVRKGDSPELGDQWVFVALDARNQTGAVL